MGMRILLVDDEKPDLDKYRKLLEATGFIVDAVMDIESAVRFAEHENYAAGVFDLYLPDPSDGIELIAKVKRCRQSSNLEDFPVLVLTKSVDRRDEIQALYSGVSEFVRKKDEDEIFVLRLRKLTRIGNEKMLIHGPIRVDLRSTEVHVGDRLVKKLPYKQYRLLVLLMSRGEAMSADFIESQLWKEKPERNSLHNLVSELRKSLYPKREIEPIIKVSAVKGYGLRKFTNEE